MTMIFDYMCGPIIKPPPKGEHYEALNFEFKKPRRSKGRLWHVVNYNGKFFGKYESRALAMFAVSQATKRGI